MIDVNNLQAHDGHVTLDDVSLDQTAPQLTSPGAQVSPGGTQASLNDRFSRKVFVGGLPPDIDEGMSSSLTSSLDLPYAPAKTHLLPACGCCPSRF